MIFHITLSEFNGNMYKSPLLSKFTKRLIIALELYISTGITIWHRVAILNVCIYAKVTFQRHQSVKLYKTSTTWLKKDNGLEAGELSWVNVQLAEPADKLFKTSGRCDPEKSKKYWAIYFKVILF